MIHLRVYFMFSPGKFWVVFQSIQFMFLPNGVLFNYSVLFFQNTKFPNGLMILYAMYMLIQIKYYSSLDYSLFMASIPWGLMHLPCSVSALNLHKHTGSLDTITIYSSLNPQKFI